MDTLHNQRTGNLGEDLAEKYLLEKGYKILERNWRYSRAEVDLIAEHDNMLILVEVKTRRSARFGLPEEAVSAKKQQQMVLAANAYAEEHDHVKEIRFDVIAITLLKGKAPEIYHIEDAFFPYQQ